MERKKIATLMEKNSKLCIHSKWDWDCFFFQFNTVDEINRWIDGWLVTLLAGRTN